MNEYRNGELVFDVRDEGPADGDVIILLHGYPETKESWEGVVPGMVAAGYRVLAPDQRGYSRRARPKGRRSYRAEHLVADVLALADAAGAERFHLVGHDWGGAVAWYCAMWHPDRVLTMTSLATPHPKAMQKALLTSTQLLHSWYFLFYQLPLLPEWSATSTVGRRMFRRTLVNSGLSEERLDHYLTVLDEPGAMTAVINWYRAVPFTPQRLTTPVNVPTLYVYGTRDFALGRRAADLTGRYVTGPYRYEAPDVSHWIPEDVPDLVVRLLLDHIGRDATSAAAS